MPSPASQLDALQIAPVFRRWSLLDYLRAGRLTSHWKTILDQDPLMQRVAMVIEVALGGVSGRSIRVSTVPIRSASPRTGTRHDAVPGLIAEPAMSADYALGQAVSSARQIDITLDALLLNPMELIRGGSILAGIAEVSLERVDVENDYDLRYVLLRGDLNSVTFGAARSRRSGGRPDDRELVTMQIIDPRESVAARLPPWVLDTTRISTLHSSGIGATYPIVLNNSLRAPTVRSTSLAVGSNSFIVAVGAVTIVAAAGNVFLNGVSVFGGVNAWVAEVTTDAKGVRYTRVRFTNAGKAWVDSDAVNVTSSALVIEQRESPVDVVRRVVEQLSPIGVSGLNAELFATAAAKYPGGLEAPRVLINASGGSAATALDWIESGFLASFPMLSMVWANGGYGPILTDSRATPVADFVVGAFPIFDRISIVSESPKSEIQNEFVIRFGYDPMLDSWAGVVVRGAANSSLCQTSRALVGQRDAQPFDSVYISDLTTATYVAEWLVQHRALPSYLVEYEASPQVFLLYQRGDTVRLSDDDFGWVEERATIERLAYQRGKCTVTFRVWLRYLDVGGGALSRPVGT